MKQVTCPLYFRSHGYIVKTNYKQNPLGSNPAQARPTASSLSSLCLFVIFSLKFINSPPPKAISAQYSNLYLTPFLLPNTTLSSMWWKVWRTDPWTFIFFVRWHRLAARSPDLSRINVYFGTTWEQMYASPSHYWAVEISNTTGNNWCYST